MALAQRGCISERVTTSLQHIADLIAERPIGVHPASMRRHLAAAALVNAAAMVEMDDEEEDAVSLRSSDGVAVFHIRGPLLSSGDWITRLFGWSDHAMVGQVADALRQDSRVRGVVLAFDSPGGDVQGMAEAAEKIERLAAAKPVYAVANHNAYSAAYALAAPAERIYVSRAGGVGSIGVVVAHVDQSQRDHAAGLKVTFLHHGDKKVDGNPHEPLSDRARADLQAEVDQLGQAFVDHVARYRGLSPQEVAAQEAGVFLGSAAVEAGMADEVGTVEDARRAMVEQLRGQHSNQSFSASANRRKRGSAAFQTRSA